MLSDTRDAAHLCCQGFDGAGPGHVVTPLDARNRLRAELDAYIDCHLGEQDLGGSLLARRFRLSRATLYRLFDDSGGVARHIRELRLRAASCQLAEPSPPRLTWLLQELGFASERQFQRAFHARFGMCPTQWRKQVGQRRVHGLASAVIRAPSQTIPLNFVGR